MMLRYPLLVDLLAVDAVRKPLQMGGPVTQTIQHRAARHGEVVLDKPSFGPL